MAINTKIPLHIVQNPELLRKWLADLAVEAAAGGGGGGGGTRVYAEYNSNAGQALTGGSWNIINFGSLVTDTHSAVTTGAAWKFTCPSGQDGDYLVTAMVNTGAAGVSNRVAGSIWKNGSIHKRTFDFIHNGGTPASVPGSAIVKLVAGDYIDYRVYTGSGGTAVEPQTYDCWICIRKLN